jgi:hypothetical protein
LDLNNVDVDWFNARRGCNHPRNRNGCGNGWSSASLAMDRRQLFCFQQL